MVSWTDAQRLAVETLDKDLLITAGAGTGKTSVLVEHAVHVLRSGVPPERLLVITFTRKAADQLRERLFQAVASHPEPALRSLMPLLPRAYIGTIHGFCQRLLRESAVTAGVDPGFRILDATGSDLLLAEATREVLDRWFEDKETGSPEHAFGRLVELCHGGAEGFEGELRRLIHAVRTTADPRGTLRRYRRRYATPYRRLYLDLVKEEIVRIREAALEVSRRLEAEVSLTEKRRGLLRCVLALSRIPVPGKRVRDLWDLRGAVLATGLVEDAGGTWKIAARDPGILAVKPSFQKLRALLDEPLLSRLPADPEGLRREERRAARFGDTLGRLLEEILDAYGDAKSSRSSVDFSDLEHLTRDLLEKEAAAGIDPARRFDHVLVDEFQDVNRLQARIIDLLSRGRRHAFVGDLKQCIYQFRLSAPEIFRDMIASHEIIEDPAAVLEGRLPRPEADAWGLRIGRSFRSRPAVLDVINGIFTHLFREETLGAPYDGQRLTPGIDPRSLGVDPPGDAPVEIHVIGSRDLDPETSGGDGRESKGPPARRRSPAEREALLSAHRLRRLVGEERPRVWDKEARAWRPVRWGDVAVLLRSPGMDWGRTFLRVFRQEGIPAHLGRGTGFFDAEEIRDALNLLRILDNSLDDIPLAALLRSPVFSWTDGDLTLLRQAFPDAKYLWLALERLADGTAPGGKGGARERLLGAARSSGSPRPRTAGSRAGANGSDGASWARPWRRSSVTRIFRSSRRCILRAPPAARTSRSSSTSSRLIQKRTATRCAAFSPGSTPSASSRGSFPRSPTRPRTATPFGSYRFTWRRVWSSPWCSLPSSGNRFRGRRGRRGSWGVRRGSGWRFSSPRPSRSSRRSRTRRCAP
jgi:ATP-dependent helicase/nuclease subunit A